MGLLDRLRKLRDAAPDDDIGARTRALVVHGNEFGFDPFGMSRDSIRRAATIARWMYRHYFRAQAFGIEHLPPAGRLLLVSNHSGQLPFDGMVIGSACFLEPEVPRLIRAMVEFFVPTVPFASYLFSRWGQITGTPENCRRLLASEEAVLVFPEGARGISKPFSQRYQLAEFGKGFMRLALETGAPIIPVAVIGAEEQAPAVNMKALAKLLRIPAFPVVPYPPFIAPLPLPVKYRVYFGEPMTFHGDPDDDDEILDDKVKMVRSKIQSMIQVGLREREHVFW
ncbi:MAG: phospholipid/glycerol acyltransferase [Myxococcales bacterium]|nr:phospholipid/glycerol acyltransferase [Myxococcales bacterium]